MQQFDTLPAYIPIEDSVVQSTSETCLIDSIFTPLEASAPVVRKSLFTHHQLPVTHSHEISIQPHYAQGWMFVVILLSILLYCIYVRSKQLHLLDLLQSAIDSRALDRMLRDTNLTHAPDQVPLALISLIPIVLVGYVSFFPQSSNPWLSAANFLLVIVICYAAYFIRNGIFRLMGNAFNNNESMHVYLSSNYIFHFLYGIVTAGMAFFVCYTGDMGQTFLYILLGILGLLLVARVIRGMLIILTLSKTSKLYLFYYLCILEIVPIAVIAKSIISL